MKFNIRWQLLLAIIGFGLVVALLSFQVQSAGLCTIRVPATGGAFVEGIVGKPQHLNPLLSDPYPVDREINNLIFDGLTQYDEAGNPAPALAQSWTVSEDGLAVEFILRRDITWHDGEPFTAADVAFTYGLLQDEGFSGPAALQTLWQSVTIDQTGPYRIQFGLPEPYGPFLSETTRGILPAHLLQGETAVSLPDSTFNQAPVGTGPFMVAPDQNWQNSSRLRLTPNPTYWRQGTKIAGLEFRFFPDYETLVEAFTTGQIHAINNVSLDILPQVATVPDVRLFTTPAPRTTAALFNLTDSGAPALQEFAVRQALAFAIDRQQLIDDVLHGQGLQLEGPFVPHNWAYNPGLLTAYAAQPETAVTLLQNAGWSQPADGGPRQNEGESLNLTLLTLESDRFQTLAAHMAMQWNAVGIGTTITATATVADLQQALSARAFDVALVDISHAPDPDLYDFWSQEAIIRGQNYGGWNDRRASEALESARMMWSVAGRRPFYDTFLRRYEGELPALTLYQHVNTYALSPEVQEAQIGKVVRPRDRYETLADWFLLYREVTVSCPQSENSTEIQ